MNLPGSVDRNIFITKNLQGNHVDPLKLIFPIYSVFNEKVSFLGTGFYIADNGLFLTAMHIIRDAIDLGHSLFTTYFQENKTYIVRPVQYAQGAEKADIAIGSFFPQLYGDTKCYVARPLTRMVAA